MDGREAGAGGWGATLGDEGSAYWISLQAMMAILQAHDGRIQETMLTKPVLAHFGMSHILDIVFRVSQGLAQVTGSGQLGVAPDSGGERPGPQAAPAGGLFFHRLTQNEPLSRHQVASLCPVVVQVARRGDWKAIQILKAAGSELGCLAVAVVSRLDMAQDEFAVVPFGGVFRAGELILHSFGQTIVATAPRAKLVKPKFEPVVGAVLLALDQAGVDIDRQVIQAIERSSAKFPACQAR